MKRPYRSDTWEAPASSFVFQQIYTDWDRKVKNMEDNRDQEIQQLTIDNPTWTLEDVENEYNRILENAKANRENAKNQFLSEIS